MWFAMVVGVGSVVCGVVDVLGDPCPGVIGCGHLEYAGVVVTAGPAGVDLGGSRAHAYGGCVGVLVEGFGAYWRGSSWVVGTSIASPLGFLNWNGSQFLRWLFLGCDVFLVMKDWVDGFL